MQKVVVLFLLLWGLGMTQIHAKGTLAGTAIQNSANIHYSIGGTDQNLTSNTDSFVVDKIVDLDLNWQDGAAVEVSSGEQSRVLTFLLSNLGNGEDDFNITYEHNATDSQFTPTATPSIYQDSNGNGLFDPDTDIEVSSLTLSADANMTLFIVSDIPPDAEAGARSYDGILAVSQSLSAVGADRQIEVDTVVRTKQDRDQGAYQIFDYWLESHKSTVVHSDDNQTHTGTHITYTITAIIGGNAEGKTITAVWVHDLIPSGTVYLPGTMKLDGVSLTDAADGDAGAFISNRVDIHIGTLSGTTPRKVQFDVQVQ